MPTRVNNTNPLLTLGIKYNWSFDEERTESKVNKPFSETPKQLKDFTW